jgi:hypothetical protein
MLWVDSAVRYQALFASARRSSSERSSPWDMMVEEDELAETGKRFVRGVLPRLPSNLTPDFRLRVAYQGHIGSAKPFGAEGPRPATV